ncbi:MAG: DUF2058 domain-containing protein [Desulfuromonas sp.]|nr:MAG: DUF2058 domain-containing protein [Desulfuromonas sp.]
MGLSLQEQLLKAGLVDKKQVKKAAHEKRVQHQKKRKGRDASDDGEKQRLKQLQSERAEQDRKLNAERAQQAKRKSDQAAAQQLIATNHLPVEEGAVVYHYVAGGQIRKSAVAQNVADKLAEGKLGLAMHNGELVLVPAETVVKVMQRDREAILAYNDPADVEDEYPTDW